MSMYTPGPWTLNLHITRFSTSIGGIYFIRGPGGMHIARLTDEEGDREANARLIVQAPAMHARLDRLAVYLETLLQLHAVTGPTIEREISETRAVLVAADIGEVHNGA